MPIVITAWALMIQIVGGGPQVQMPYILASEQACKDFARQIRNTTQYRCLPYQTFVTTVIDSHGSTYTINPPPP